MRIALFHNLPSGGAKRHTYEQVKELARRGHVIVEYAPSTANMDYCSFMPFVKEQRVYEAPRLNLTHKRLPLVTPYFHALQLAAYLRQTDDVNMTIARSIDSEQYDLALVKDCQIMSNPFVLRHLVTRSIFQCHHGGRPTFDRRRRLAQDAKSVSASLKKLYYSPAHAAVARYMDRHEIANIRSADRVLTNSRYSEGILLDLFGVKSSAIYPGIDTQLFSPKNLPEADYVLSVGALIYSKGHRFVVSALAQIDAAMRPKLFIAANSRDPDEERAVRAMAAEAGVDLHVETITDSQRLVDVYNQAKVFVYAPLQEALGLAPLEAMACATPVVAVGEGGVQETILHGSTGYLVDRDPVQFARFLEQLLFDSKLRTEMGAAAADYVRTQWTWPKAVDELEKQFALLMASPNIPAMNP